MSVSTETKTFEPWRSLHTYLKGNLEGPPLTTIGPLALTEENYEKVIGMLEDRYGRPDKI